MPVSLRSCAFRESLIRETRISFLGIHEITEAACIHANRNRMWLMLLVVSTDERICPHDTCEHSVNNTHCTRANCLPLAMRIVRVTSECVWKNVSLMDFKWKMKLTADYVKYCLHVARNRYVAYV